MEETKYISGRIENDYVIDNKSFDEGGYGGIHIVYNKDGTRSNHVVKIQQNIKLSYSLSEIQISAMFSHEHLINYKRVYIKFDYKNNNKPWMTSFLQDKGVPFITQVHLLTSDKRRKYIFNIIDTMAFLQSHNIIHADIKPENMILIGNKLKFIDYGMMYNIGCGSQPVIQTYSDIGGYQLKKRNVYINETSNTLRNNVQYDILNETAWAVGYTILVVACNFKASQYGVREGVPIYVYKADRDIMSFLMSIKNLDTKYMHLLSLLMAPYGQRIVNFAALLDDRLFNGLYRAQGCRNHAYDYPYLTDDSYEIENFVDEIIDLLPGLNIYYHVVSLFMEYVYRLTKEFFTAKQIKENELAYKEFLIACFLLAGHALKGNYFNVTDATFLNIVYDRIYKSFSIIMEKGIERIIDNMVCIIRKLNGIILIWTPLFSQYFLSGYAEVNKIKYIVEMSKKPSDYYNFVREIHVLSGGRSSNSSLFYEIDRKT